MTIITTFELYWTIFSVYSLSISISWSREGIHKVPNTRIMFPISWNNLLKNKNEIINKPWFHSHRVCYSSDFLFLLFFFFKHSSNVLSIYIHLLINIYTHTHTHLCIDMYINTGMQIMIVSRLLWTGVKWIWKLI